jgi:hypothetical protein
MMTDAKVLPEKALLTLRDTAPLSRDSGTSHKRRVEWTLGNRILTRQWPASPDPRAASESRTRPRRRRGANA